MGEPVLAALEAPLERLLRKDAARDGAPLTHFGRGGLTKKTAGYVLLGTGAALLLGGAFFGLQANGQAATFRTTPQTDETRGSALAQSGRSQALRADLFLLGGLLAAAPGGYLAFAGAAPAKGGTREVAVPPGPKKTDPPAAPPPSQAGESPGSLPQGKESKPPRQDEAQARDEAAKAAKAAAAEKDEADRAKALEEQKKEAERKKAEEEKKKKKSEKKRKRVDEDDLRNY